MMKHLLHSDDHRGEMKLNLTSTQLVNRIHHNYHNMNINIAKSNTESQQPDSPPRYDQFHQ